MTFWASPDGSSHGYGRGTYYMLDSSYQVFRKFEAVGEGLMGDLHEFKITDRGTALVTVYNPVPADLTSVGGPEEGWALDCLFQELDIETGALLFEWSALEHVPLSDVVRYFAGEDDGTTPETAFDFFHINSVDLLHGNSNGGGSYVVSARHTSTILCIDSQTGEIEWTLGGASSDFTDLSGGEASDFLYQHHAQIHSLSSSSSNSSDNNNNDGTQILLSIFDNAVAERAGPRSPHPYSRGLLIQLDTVNKTATLARSFADPSRPRAADSQGSMQVLRDRVVLGYGWLPFVTEFARDDGAVLCDLELAPWVAARWGLVNSYRASKAMSWVGRPTEAPKVVVEPRGENVVYVSWNGATEVKRWVLQGAEWSDLRAKGEGDGEDGFVDLDDVLKTSFETALAIREDMPRYLRVVALDKDGNVLARTQIVDRFVGNVASDWVHDVLVWVAVGVALVVAALLIARKRGRRVLLGGSTRWCDWVARAVSESGIYERYPFMAWWRGWRGAKEHELQALYHD